MKKERIVIIILILHMTMLSAKAWNKTDVKIGKQNQVYDSLLEKSYQLLYVNVEEGKKVNMQMLDLAKKQRNDYGIVLSYLNQAYYSIFSEDIKNAFHCLEIAKIKVTENYPLFAQGYLLYIEGLLNCSMEYYAKGIELLQKSFLVFREMNDSVWMVKSMEKIGKSYCELGDYKQSMYSYKIMEKWLFATNKYSMLNVAELYNIIGKPDSALHICKTIREKVRQQQNTGKTTFQHTESDFLAFFSTVCFGAYKEINQYDSALVYANMLETIAQSTGFSYHKRYARLMQAEIAYCKKEYSRAIKLYQEVLESYKGIQTYSIQIKALKGLATCYVALGNYKKAFEYQSNASHVFDSLMEQNRQSNVALWDLQLHYEKQMELLRQEKEKNKSRMISIIGISAIVGLVFFILYQQKRLKEKWEKLLRIEKEKLLEQRQSQLLQTQIEYTKTQEQIKDFSQQVKEIASEMPKNIRVQLLQNMTLLEEEQNKKIWEEFEKNFERKYGNFKERLLFLYPSLTLTEIKLCMLLKMKVSNKELSSMLHIAPNSVKTYRLRIRKKMKIENSEQTLFDFLDRI